MQVKLIKDTQRSPILLEEEERITNRRSIDDLFQLNPNEHQVISYL